MSIVMINWALSLFVQRWVPIEILNDLIAAQWYGLFASLPSFMDVAAEIRYSSTAPSTPPTDSRWWVFLRVHIKSLFNVYSIVLIIHLSFGPSRFNFLCWLYAETFPPSRRHIFISIKNLSWSVVILLLPTKDETVSRKSLNDIKLHFQNYEKAFT